MFESIPLQRRVARSPKRFVISAQPFLQNEICYALHRPIAAVLEEAGVKIEDSVDRIKTDAGDLPLIAVGGGAFLVPGRVAGVSEVVRVPHGDCANAVGAAIAQISGETDQVYRDLARSEAIALAEAQATERAVAAGADRTSLQTIDIEDMPLAYLPGNALRVRVRVAGEMAVPEQNQPAASCHDILDRDRLAQTLQGEIADLLECDGRLDRGGDALAEQDPAVTARAAGRRCGFTRTSLSGASCCTLCQTGFIASATTGCSRAPAARPTSRAPGS
jgi:hypothetical protein